ncbi:hypothetical protein J009_02100 [Cryptococcus neoformans]|nr:hypothetical protein J009_02100 [Cryptococcus neoformans var. grubii]
MAWNLEPTVAVWPTQLSAAACSSTCPPTLCLGHALPPSQHR